VEQLAKELHCGVPTMEDIFDQLIRLVVIRAKMFLHQSCAVMY
jgi:hypothetical protein